MSNINIEFNIKNKSWLKYDKNISVSISNFLEEVSRKIKLNRILKKNINIEISVLLTNNDQIKELNKNYLYKDKETNILAFPLHDLDLKKNQVVTEYLFDNSLILGDLVLSLEYIQNEALMQGKLIDHHLKHLLLHGLLHLIGYDHIESKEREEMERLEIKILEESNISDPYADNQT